MQIKNKHSIIIIILLLIFLLLEGIYLYVVPRFFDLSKRIPAIETFYREKTGSYINIDKLKLTTHADFSIGLRTESLSLATPDGKKAFQADDFYAKIYLLPLLIKDVSIAKISAKSLDITAIRNIDGHFNLEKLIPKSDKKIFNVKIKNTKFNISKYNISFKDNKLKQDFEIYGNYFKISNLTMKKLIDLETQGSIRGKNLNTEFQVKFYSKFPILKHIGNSDFVASGYVKNLTPKPLSPYIQQYLDKEIKHTDGNASFNFYTKKENKQNKIFAEGVINNLLIKKQLEEDSIFAEGKNIISTTLIVNDNKLNIESFFIKGQKYKIEAQGLIKDYRTKKPQLDTIVQIQQSRAENIIKLLPSNLIKGREEIKKVKRYGVLGDLNGQIHVKGKLPEPNITGKIEANNVHIVKDSKIPM